MKLSCPGSSEDDAVSAGNPSVTRKTATPASNATIVTAAITATLLKIRSPRHRGPPGEQRQGRHRGGRPDVPEDPGARAAAPPAPPRQQLAGVGRGVEMSH